MGLWSLGMQITCDLGNQNAWVLSFASIVFLHGLAQNCTGYLGSCAALLEPRILP